MQAQALQQAQQEVQKEAERVQKDELKVGKMMDEARNSMDKYNAQLKSDREKRQLEERLAEANAPSARQGRQLSLTIKADG